MKECKTGDILRIESYKHNGKLHRTWERSIVLEGGDPLLLANRNVRVTEADGRQWISRNLAICQFHRTKWFNTIVLFNFRKKYRWYCNIASPCRLEAERLIYTDYDLDLSVDETGKARWLDRNEFEENRRRMAYPQHVIREVKRAAAELDDRFRAGREPFTPAFVQAGYHRYLSYEKQLMG
ncbi:DUF402 domain-containing protein [Salinithrix halophila]|uniref:DUF402 domain-containing protein n=1 Tax=Salinithrix halophila TaxID=1485204 RepID=A0ABV8JJY5_9BACL